MATAAFQPPPPPLRLDEGGIIRIGRTRVALQSVVFAYDQGATAEEILLQFPGLELPEVYAVLAYVLHNRKEVDHYMRSQEQEAEKARQEAKPYVPSDLRARLLRRKANSRGDSDS